MNKVYEIVTEKIIKQLEEGTVPWQRSWNTLKPAKNFISKKSYRGLNAFLLFATNYRSAYWGTFKQIASKGGRVKKGEKGSLVVFWKMLKTKDEKNEGKFKTVPCLRYYQVWNLEQTEGLEKYWGIEEKDNEKKLSCEEVVTGMPNPPKIEFGKRPLYRPASDVVEVPDIKNFDTSEAYYGTLFHELGHATGHASRLNRSGITKTNGFGNEEYSKEELVAEMTAAFLNCKCGVDAQENKQSAAYIASWLKVLKGDPKMVVQAAGAAQKAADYICGIQPETFEAKEEPVCQ